MEKNQTIYEAFKDGAKLDKKAPSIIYLGKTFSYKSVEKSIDTLKDSLINAGLTSKEVVITCLPNIPQAVYLIYATIGAGGVAFPIHALSSSEQAEQAILTTKAKFFFALSVFAEQYKNVCEKHGVLLVSVSPTGELNIFKRALFNIINKKAANIMTYPRFLRRYKAEKSSEIASLKPEDTAILLNSGGTSGMPKIVELSSFALNDLCSNGLEILNVSSVKNKYMLSALPYFHGFGLAMGLHAMLCFGGCNVLIPKFRRKHAMRYILRKKITYMIGVPALYGAVMSHKKFAGKILKPIKIAFVGGDFVPQVLIESFNKRMAEGGSEGKMYEGYGLTETVTVCTVNLKNANKPLTVGKPLKGIEIEAFDIDSPSLPLKRGTKGELYFRGGTLMNGYYNDEAATKETFFEDKTGKIWLKTGDCGLVDEDGYIHFKQRLKRIIKVSGVSVFPAEIEQAVCKIEGVSQVCAFGVEDKKRGHAVVLAVETLQEDTQNLKETIVNTIKKELNHDSQPKEIYFTKSFPMTKMNKIDYAELKKLYENNKEYS